ncbi:MAG TPA: luciferase family protein [Gaiellaceae bacterium]|nr:luciferase family protein [Gaiellaceae bacterium]
MIDELFARLAELPDVEQRPSQFHGEPALWIDGREFIHTHGERWIEIRLTGKLFNQLDDERAMRRSRTSDWVMVDANHADLIVDLARQALEANRRS